MKIQIFRYLLVCCLITASGSPLFAMKRIIKLDKDWYFYKGDVDVREIGNLNWESIEIPHTWNTSDGQSSDYYRGKCSYMRPLRIETRHKRGKRVYLCMERTGIRAEIYVNGVYVNSHEGLLGQSLTDITSFLNEEAHNVLVLKVDNYFDENYMVFPENYTLFGGILSSVNLLFQEPLLIAMPGIYSKGVQIRQTEINENFAVLDVKAKIENRYTYGKAITVNVTVYDHLDTPLSFSADDTIIHLRSGYVSNHMLKIENPVLWDGVNNPYLYRVFFELKDKESVVDTLSEYIGIRDFYIDPGKGFFLNGKPYELKGVNLYPDHLGKGPGLSEKDMEDDIRLVREMGANAVRTSYYPYPDIFYSLCDKYGLIVWIDCPLTGLKGMGQNNYINLENELKIFIRQKYNHPSVFFWGIYDNATALSESNINDKAFFVQDLKKILEEEDPFRIPVIITDLDRLDRIDGEEDVAIMANTFSEWEGEAIENANEILKKQNRYKKKNGIGLADYGIGGNIPLFHENAYKWIRNNKFVWGAFIGNMFDHACPGNCNGTNAGVDNRGLISYDREIRKDAFYFYKANWSSEPFVYIADKEYETSGEEKTNIKVYSNCDKVRLYVNGKDYGSTKVENGVFLWKNIPLINGSNLIYVNAPGFGNDISDQCIRTKN